MKRGGTVLTGLTHDSVQVLVLGLDLALAELRTYSRLLHARTFAGARSDPFVAALIEAHVGVYLRHVQQEDGNEDVDPAVLERRHTGPRARWDAQEFWGDDYWSFWHPEPRSSTAQWLAGTEPELWGRWSAPDTAWGFDYQPEPLIPARDRDAVEAELRALGYRVVHVPRLADLYLDDPGRNARTTLRAAITASVTSTVTTEKNGSAS